MIKHFATISAVAIALALQAPSSTASTIAARRLHGARERESQPGAGLVDTRNDIYTFVFGGSEQIANQANVVLRPVVNSTASANGAILATRGTSRVDNFAVMATPVSEPDTCAMLLAGLAVVAFGARRRH